MDQPAAQPQSFDYSLLVKIGKEATLDIPPSGETATPEALKLRQQIEAENAQLKQQGLIPQVPNE